MTDLPPRRPPLDLLAAAASIRSADVVTADDLRDAFDAVLSGAADALAISRVRRAVADGDPQMLYACFYSETAVERLLDALVRLHPSAARAAVVIGLHLRLTPSLIASWVRVGKGLSPEKRNGA